MINKSVNEKEFDFQDAIDSQVTDIYEHMIMAKKEAIKAGIKANLVIISPSVAKVNKFFVKTGGNIIKCNDGVHSWQYTEQCSIAEVPEMILGMKVKYDNLLDEIPANFIICEDPTPEKKEKTLADYSIDELLDEIRRRTNEEEY